MSEQKSQENNLSELEKAAFNEAADPSNIRNTSQHIFFSFIAGAEWQKEKFNRLIELIKESVPVLLCEGFDDLVEQINNELESLQE